MGGAWRLKDESVSLERLDGETILINFDTGQYFSFHGPAADVLSLVQANVDRASWPPIAEAAYPGLTWDAGIEAQVDEFLDGLAEVGVIVESDRPSGPDQPLPDDVERSEWVAPTVFANDDLVDLLVIDPIHDASEDGWPQTRQDG